MVSVELTDEEAKLFCDFRKYQDEFTALKNAGAFGILESGKIILNINNNFIVSIVVEKRVFDRKKLSTEY